MMTSCCGVIKNAYTLIQQCVWKYLRNDLQTGHQKSKSKGEQNDACHSVALTTVLLLVLFKYNMKFLFSFKKKQSTLKNVSRNLFDNMGSKSVPVGTLSLTFRGRNLRYLFFRPKETGAK